MHAVTTIVPLKMGKDKVVRIGNTRVTLEVMIASFKGGSTPEEIVYQYPVLDLADVYAVISYYLKNQATVEAYLQETYLQSEQLKHYIQSQFPETDTRQRLLAKKYKN